ncbi:MAG: entericidin A/B family lipoprotein [Planctomycetota bacterium]|nr:entericidin A/B family lipoprotein [Planctomycetota bacterium]
MSVSKFFRRFMVLAGLASCLALASCNTIEGAGEDVESAGEAVQDAADGD